MGTEKDLRQLFPKATEITLPMNRKAKQLYGYAFVAFSTTQLATEFHDKCQGSSVKGNSVVVLYAKKRKGAKDTAKKEVKEKAPKIKEAPAKKKLVEIKDEEDNEEDDEEDDDDDSEDDNDDDDDDDDDDSDEDGDDDNEDGDDDDDDEDDDD